MTQRPDAENREAARALQRDWFEAAPGDEGQRLLDRLFADYLHPWAAQATRRTIRLYAPQGLDQAGDVESEVMLQLTARLTDLRASGEPPIDDLRAYVSSAVSNACLMRLRARCPERSRLQNRIRYLLRHDERFALWKTDGGGLLAGRGEMRGAQDHTNPVTPAFLPGDLRELIAKVLERTGRPVLFSALVALAAEMLQIADTDPVSLSHSADLPSSETATLTSLIAQQNLSKLWGEILLLPLNQRTAVLLNLRDSGGDGVIELMPALGIATFQQLAESLALTAEELAAMWNELPMDDVRIALRLGVNRQQVVNLRKSARERLGRRIKNNENMRPESASSTALTALRRTERAIRNLFARQGTEVL